MLIRKLHHGNRVWVKSKYDGLNQDICLCYTCQKFRPNTLNNCCIAQRVYENCVKYGLVTPVMECAHFKYIKPIENFIF